MEKYLRFREEWMEKGDLKSSPITQRVSNVRLEVAALSGTLSETKWKRECFVLWGNHQSQELKKFQKLFYALSEV